MHSFEERFFERTRLRAGQMKSVADRRREDARFLFKSADKRYYNGSIYLYGIAIECLLKALVLEAEPWLESASWPSVRESGNAWQMGLYLLVYRWHRLDELLGALPRIQREMQREMKTWAAFAGIEQWSTFIRYCPYQVRKDDAHQFIQDAEVIFKWLRSK